MGKVDELEKRIVELEKTVQALKNKNKKDSMISLGVSLTMRDPEGYENHLKEKFSIKRYKNDGADEKFYELDFSNMLKEAEQAKNKIEKLKVWKKHSVTIASIVNNRYSAYWFQLTSFVESAIEYYEKSLIEYVLKEGKYFDIGGRPTEYDKEFIINRFEEINPKRGQITNAYLKIADEIGVPEFLSDRTKSIAKIVRENKRK